jgi:transposase InsO family protein
LEAAEIEFQSDNTSKETQVAPAPAPTTRSSFERFEDLRERPRGSHQKAFIERFNRTYREEVLTPYLFDSLADVQQITDEWL